MSAVEREQTKETIDTSHFPRHVLERRDGAVDTAAITGAVILHVVNREGIKLTPTVGLEESWARFMPGPLLRSLLGESPIRVLEMSQERLDNFDLGPFNSIKDSVACHLELLLDRTRSASQADIALGDLDYYRNHGNGD